VSVEQQIEKLQGLLERVQRNATLPRPAAPPPAIAAAPPEPAVEEPVEEEEVEDVDLFDEDIVDLTADEIGAEEIGAEEIAATGPELEEDIFFEDEEEIEPPASSRRPKVAASMDEALAGAAELEMDQGREVPLKTPPPESGRQVAGPPPQGLHQPAPPADFGSDVDDLLEADISSGTQHAKPAVPTPEQLGQTIDLEEGAGVPLELDAPVQPPEPTRAEELEAPLPPREAHGSYSAGLAPPPEARAELEARRRREAEPPAAPSAPPPAPPGEVKPEIVQRPAVAASGPAAQFLAAHREFKPESFLELLDASLSLGE
jgi:hypothetical protein